MKSQIAYLTVDIIWLASLILKHVDQTKRDTRTVTLMALFSFVATVIAVLTGHLE